MNRLGVLLIVLGFGSAAMKAAHSDFQFVLLSWSDPMQPWLGIVLGIAGVVLLAVRIARGRRTQAAAAGGPSPYGLQAPASGQVDPYGNAGPRPYTNGVQQPGPAASTPAPYGGVANTAPPQTGYPNTDQPPR